MAGKLFFPDASFRSPTAVTRAEIRSKVYKLDFDLVR